MRADMAKVIVERPRYGSRAPARKKGYRKYVQRAGFDNLPRREPMLGRWHGRGRWLNEHLGPMRRFLRSNVGRPWNKVHQELCEHVSFDNPVQSHVLSHVFDYVQRYVEVRGGEVFATMGWRRGRPLDPGTMYICPVTGLLKEVRRGKPRRLPASMSSGRDRQVHRRAGVWWELRLRCFSKEAIVVRQHTPRRPNHGGESAWDVWLERTVTAADEQELRALYGDNLVAISMRPLSRQETSALESRRAKKRSLSARR